MRQIITAASQIGEIIRARRKAQKLSQAELAARLGISQSRLSVIEHSPETLTLDRLIALSNVLGLSLVLEDKPARSAKRSEPAW
jgi:HTH-type transcriptional regulator / antitoxin HipB